MNVISEYIKKYGPDKASEISGYARSTLYAWANGSRRPDPNKLNEISERLGISKQKLRPDLYSKA